MAYEAPDPRAFITDEIKAQLKTPDFDMWHFSREQCVYLLEYIFNDLGYVSAFNIDPKILENFLHTIRNNYNETPFHNFHHCFCVTQMVYAIFSATKDMTPFLTLEEKFAVSVSAVCHDLDHNGLNNSYQVNARSELAVTYNDQSPLENHHCATGFRILSRPTCNIFQHLSLDQYKSIRKIIISCVLSTDMAKHFSLRGQFADLVTKFDYANGEHRQFLCQFVLMCADISNEVRPWWVSRPWATNLMEEFFQQSDREKREGLPYMPFMDREKAQLESGQIGFIKGILRPLWAIAAELLPTLSAFIDRIDNNLSHWQKFHEHKNCQILIHLVGKDRIAGTLYRAGDRIVKMGEVSSKMYFLKNGSVDVVGADMATVWDTMSRGTFFGEVGAFKGVARTANIVAKTDCEIMVVEKDDVLSILEDHPEHKKMIEDITNHRLEIHEQRMEKMKPQDLVEFGG